MDQPESAEVNISYDRDADVLYVAFGEPVAGVDEEVEEGVFVRREADGSSVVGFTIMDFVCRAASRPALRVPIGAQTAAG